MAFNRNLAAEQLDPVSNGIFQGYKDVLDPLFGPRPTPSPSNPHEMRNRAAWTYSDSKAGVAQYLGMTTMDLVFTANQSYMTDRVLPWIETNDIHFTIDKIEYNAHVLGRTPAFSASRYMKQRKFSRVESLKRMGIAFIFEHDFARTPAGRTSFYASLAQISRAVQETANAEGVRALLYASANSNHFLNTQTTVTEQTLRDYFTRDRERFGLAQKEDYGLEKLSVEINVELNKHNGRKDLWLLAQNMADYVEFRYEKVENWRAGENGPKSVNTPHSIDNPNPTRFIKEDPVYLVRSKKIEGIGEADPLGRYRQTGSYNTLRDECGDYSDYVTASRNRELYNEDKDDWDVVTLFDCLKYCELFDSKGELNTPPPHKRDANHQRGMSHDFLLFKSKGSDQFRDVRYFGDIDLDYLPTKHVLNCAQTLRNALVHRVGQAKFNEFQSALADIQPNADGVYPTADTVFTEQRYAAYTSVVRALLPLLGSDNIYFAGENVSETGNFEDAVRRFYEAFVLQGVAPVNARISEEISETIEDIDQKFLDNLMLPVPPTKRDEVQTLIAESSSLPVFDVADRIQAKYEEYAEAKIKGKEFNKLLKGQGIADYIQERKDHYNKRVSELKKGKRKSPIGKIAGYMRTGLNLTGTPYEYVNPAAAQHNPNPLAEIPVFRNILDKRQQEQQQRVGAGAQSVRRGDGTFSGIGRVMRDGGEKGRREAPPKGVTAPVNPETIGFTWHIESLRRSAVSLMDRVLALAYLGIKLNKRNLENLAHNNVCIPIDFILARPHQARHTQSAIACAGGGATGNTFFTMPGLEIAHEANTKFGEGHFTMWLRSIVLNPENNWVQHDVFADGYFGGNGCEFYDSKSYKNINWDDIERSIICIAIPVTEKRIGDKNGTLDLTGGYSVEYMKDLGQHIGQINKSGPHYSTYWRYNTLYNFNNQLRRGSARPDMSISSRHINRVCEPAAQRSYLPKTGEWSEPTVNRDHFGPYLVGPGTADIRRGRKRYINSLQVMTQR